MTTVETNLEAAPIVRRGRTPKYATEEERKKAKHEQTLASNKKLREERNKFLDSLLPEQHAIIRLVSKEIQLNPIQCHLIKKICNSEEIELPSPHIEEQLHGLITDFEAILLDLIQK
jgi:hypothetical protein